jgi:hypothetical protein
MHLDFIYGKIESQSVHNIRENNYNHVESILAFAKAYTTQVKVGLTGIIPTVDREVLALSKSKLLPLDGQQRLTTLWLVHFVLYHQSNMDIPSWMHNFNYKTRKSSTSFITSLIQNTDIDKFQIYSTTIEKSKWFYKNWLQDPTVKGILVTLDEVQQQLNERLISFDGEERKLKIEQWITNFEQQDNCAIQFSFLPLSDIDVEDDIYIKMNDRGKQLSDFEIFKNDLLDYLKNLIDNNVPDFNQNEYDIIAKNIDKKWHDIFWNEKDKDSFNVEFGFHYFFLYHLLLYRISNNQKENLISVDYFSALIGDKRCSNFEQFDFRELEKLDLISLDSLKYVFQNLEIFTENDLIKSSQKITDEICFKKDGKPEFGNNFLKHFLKSASGNIGYYDRTYNYAISKYLFKYKSNLDINFLKQWCRVLQNLVYNQAYIQGKDDFETAIKHVNQLLEYGPDIEETLFSHGTGLNVFPRQLSEEIEKVCFYKIQPELYPYFLKFEGHPFFHGQIEFLINLSKDKKKSNIDIDELIIYGEKLAFIFQPANIDDGKFLFARALLNELNYFNNKGLDRWQFFSNKNELRKMQEGWRQLFNNTEHLKVLKSFLTKISAENINSDLTEITNKYVSNQWEYYFVQEAGLWKLGVENMFRKTSNDNVRIWRTTRGYGEQYELRTKYLHLTWGDDLGSFQEFKYLSVNSEDEHPFCYFDGWKADSYNYRLEIRFFESKYQIKFINTDSSTFNEIEQLLINRLTGLEFIDDGDKEYILKVNEQDILSKLKELLDYIKQKP